MYEILNNFDHNIQRQLIFQYTLAPQMQPLEMGQQNATEIM